MSTGNFLYLLMTIGSFVGFALVLAYQSWEQGKLGPEMLVEPVAEDAPAHALAV